MPRRGAGHAGPARSPIARSSLGLAITALIARMALLSLVWTPYDVTRLVVADRLQPPSAAHWFGTDHFGRDVLSMIMVGARNSIAVALVAVGDRHGHRRAARRLGRGARRRRSTRW